MKLPLSQMNLPPLYPILDTESVEKRDLPLVKAAEAMLEGGARILQLRHKGHFSRSLFEQAEQIGQLCARFGAIWIVDDRVDMAKLLGAGVHLGQDDLTPAMAREILGPDSIIGYSTHNEAQLESAPLQPVDYVAFGPIYSTGSKLNPDPVLGVDELRRCRRLANRPLVAIGGIKRDNALSVLAAGADSLAVIGDLLPEPGDGACLRSRIEEWLQLVHRKPA